MALGDMIQNVVQNVREYFETAPEELLGGGEGGGLQDIIGSFTEKDQQ